MSPFLKKSVKFTAFVTSCGLVSTAALAEGSALLLTTSPGTGGAAGAGYVRPVDPVASVFGNPATLMQLEGKADILFGASLINLNPKTTHDGSVVPAFSENSSFKTILDPTIALRYRLSDDWVMGMGLTVVSGLAADVRDAPLSPVVSTVTFGANFSAAYAATEHLTVGATAQIGYGLLEFGPLQGTALSEELSARLGVGLTYDLGKAMVGVNYNMPMKQKFDEVTATSMDSNGVVTYADARLDLPHEVEIGIATTDAWSDTWLIEVDGIYMGWGSANGFKSIWKDQYSVALGVHYRQPKWAVRAGFALSNPQIREDISAVNEIGGISQILIPAGPGGTMVPMPIVAPLVEFIQSTISEAYWNKRISAGFSYNLNEKMALDMSTSYAYGKDRQIGGNFVEGIYNLQVQAGVRFSF